MMAIKLVVVILYIGIFNINKIDGNEASKSEQYCSNLNINYPANMYNNSSLIEEFPHMAAIKCTIDFFNRTISHWRCAGVLITEKYVLTTAHCMQFFDYENGFINEIWLGSNNLDSNNTDQNVQSMKAAKLIQHPDFQKDSVYNDIALIELEKEIKITDYVRPICLDNDKKLYSSLTVASYQLFLRSHIGNKDPRKLAKWNYTESAYNECKLLYKNSSNLVNGIAKNEHICVKNLNNNLTELESGDPLQTFDPIYGYKLVGIVDFSKRAMKQINYVCYRISHHINWIESIVWPNVSLNLV